MSKKRPKENVAERRGYQFLDDLSEFQRFQEKFLKIIRQDLDKGLSADAIYKKYEGFAAARAATIVMTEPDSGKALNAIKEIRDRASGKAKEVKEVEHKFSMLPEEELDAVLLSQLEELDDIQADETEH